MQYFQDEDENRMDCLLMVGGLAMDHAWSRLAVRLSSLPRELRFANSLTLTLV